MSTWSVDLGSAIVSVEVKVDDVGEILTVARASSAEFFQGRGRGHAEWGTSTVEKDLLCANVRDLCHEH